MTKNISLSFFLLLLSFTCFSQKASFGMLAGGNLSKLYEKRTHSEAGTTYKPGFHLGLLSNFRLAKALVLQPEIVYSAQGFQDASWGGKTTTYLNYLNIPVMAKIYLNEKFYLQTGPQLGFLLSAREKGTSSQNNSININTREHYGTADFSLCAGLGVDILQRFSLSGRYNFGLKGVYKGRFTGPNNRVFQLSLSLKLGEFN